jgi:hypothetical protein
MKVICTLLLLVSASASASQCLSYGETALEGTLSIETFSGGKRGDKPETYFFVSPARPFCVNGTKQAAFADNISKVPIAINRKGGWPIMKALVGTQVSCRGTLRVSAPDHYRSPVLLQGICHAVRSA